jgi:16S rRNA processing protein RimM
MSQNKSPRNQVPENQVPENNKIISTNNRHILIGRIVGVFGVKGLVKIESYCQNPEEIFSYQTCKENGEALEISLAQKLVNNYKKNQTAIFISKIAEVDSRNLAEEFIDCKIFTSEDSLPATSQDEYYLYQLSNLKVIDTANNKELGIVLNACEFGAGAMLAIDFNDEVIAQHPKEITKNQLVAFKNLFFPVVEVNKGLIKLDFQALIDNMQDD